MATLITGNIISLGSQSCETADTEWDTHEGVTDNGFVTTFSYDDSYSHKFTVTASPASIGTAAIYNGIASSTSYTLSCRARAGSATVQLQPQFTWFDGSYTPTNSFGSVTNVPSGAWTSVFYTVTSPADAEHLALHFDITANVNDVVYVDFRCCRTSSTIPSIGSSITLAGSGAISTATAGVIAVAKRFAGATAISTVTAGAIAVGSAVALAGSSAISTVTNGAVAVDSASPYVTAAGNSLFRPPTESRSVQSQDPVWIKNNIVSQQLARHYGEGLSGITVWKKTDGTYTEAQPDDTDIALTYQGGHIHEVDFSEARALTAAGYGAYVDPPVQFTYFLRADGGGTSAGTGALSIVTSSTTHALAATGGSVTAGTGALTIVAGGTKLALAATGGSVTHGTSNLNLITGSSGGSRDAVLWPFSSGSATAGSPFNVPIGSGAVFVDYPDIRDGAGMNADNGYSHPIYPAVATDPNNTITTTTSLQFGSNGQQTFRVPGSAVPESGSDAHMHVVEPPKAAPRYVWEGIGCFRTSSTSWQYYRLERNDLYGEGWGAGGCRSSGMSAIAGLIRKWEFDQGLISHTLAFALAPYQQADAHVWPATEHDEQSSFQNTGSIPMGSLFAIPGTVNINGLGLTAGGLILAKTMQDFGCYLTDRNVNTGFTLYFEPTISSGSARFQQMLTDEATLRNLLRRVSNNSPTSRGGGGTPRTSLAPPLA